MSSKLEVILKQISRGCPEIPYDLRHVSGQVWQADRISRATALGKVALSYLPAQCQLADPNEPATALSYSCPLPNQHTISPYLLANVDAGTYGYIWALSIVFGELGLYDSTKKISGHQVIKNLLLATAKSNEATSDRQAQ
ncbi:hypothetical protein [uncultured Desulfobacter sp.]|uniref:hypothetical protein n=1 Tax=uncultured Desulfobacter sp. TaxID=240139 RepID=UPI0029F5CC11|nr:hypothetical protein [uncultured Desulfobacter sp.]